MRRTQAIPRPRKMKKTFKLVISAGHYLGNPKGCLKSLDPNETREWVLNDRVADKLEKILADYDGIEILNAIFTKVPARNGEISSGVAKSDILIRLDSGGLISIIVPSIDDNEVADEPII